MRALRLGAALAVACTASLAAAQSSVPKPVGIKLGEGRLHPYLSVAGQYDSLVGYFNRVAGVDVAAGDILFGFRPGVDFELTGPSTSVTFAGYGEYLLYTGLLSPAATALSRIQANVAVDARFNQDGVVEVQLGDSLIRSDRTQNPAAGVGVMSLFNDARLAVPIHPGGRALEVTPRVSWQVELFDPLLTGINNGCAPGTVSCDPTQVNRMNYSNLQFALTGRWKFLPKTALTIDNQFDYRTYLVDPASNPQGLVFRTQAGLLGLISPRVSVTILAGYGRDFARSGANTVIGQAEVAYLPTELIKVSLGYLRTVQPVPIFGTFGDDRGYLSAKVGVLGGRLTLSGQFGADYLSYYSLANRNDLMLNGSAGAAFDVAAWFLVSASYALSYRMSFQDTLRANNYVRHEARLSLVLRY